jgi:hypothetical protein
MGRLEVSEGKKNDPTSMLVANPIIGMNLNSSQIELVQSWGLGHSGHHFLPTHASLYPTSLPPTPLIGACTSFHHIQNKVLIISQSPMCMTN